MSDMYITVHPGVVSLHVWIQRGGGDRRAGPGVFEPPPPLPKILIPVVLIYRILMNTFLGHSLLSPQTHTHDFASVISGGPKGVMGLPPPPQLFACQYEKSHGLALSRTLNPP